MAITVPRADRSVELHALSDARVSTNAPSGAFDSGLSQVNKVAQQIFAEEKKKADATAFYSADLEASKLQAQIETKYKTERVGDRAMGAAQDADIEFEKESAKIRGALSTDQQEIFDRSLSQRRGALYSVLEHHASSERKKYDDQVISEYAAGADREIISSADLYADGDPASAITADKNIGVAISRKIGAVNKIAADNGYAQSWIDNKTAEVVAGAHRQVVDSLLANGKDMLASDYFKIHEKEIISAGTKDIDQLHKALAEGSVRGESQRAHDAIMQMDKDWAGKYNVASAIENPKVREATTRLLDESRNRENSIQTERDQENFVRGAIDAEKAGTTRAIPPQVWAAYTPAQRTVIEERLRHVKEGTEPAMDYKVWTNFTSMPVRELAKLTPSDMMLKYRPKLDNQHYDDALRQFNAAQKALAAGSQALSAMQSDSDIVKNAWLQYKGKAKVDDLNDDGRKQMMEFYDKSSVEVQKFEQKNGRKATDEEKQTIVRKALKDQVFIKEFGRDPQVPAFVVKEDQHGGVYVPVAEIPLKGREGLVNWARSRGIIPQNATQSDAEAFLGKRLEKAYALGLVGASDESWMSVLSDGPNMPQKRNRTSVGLIKGN